MDCIVHGVVKSQTWLKDFHFLWTSVPWAVHFKPQESQTGCEHCPMGNTRPLARGQGSILHLMCVRVRGVYPCICACVCVFSHSSIGNCQVENRQEEPLLGLGSQETSVLASSPSHEGLAILSLLLWLYDAMEPAVSWLPVTSSGHRSVGQLCGLDCGLAPGVRRQAWQWAMQAPFFEPRATSVLGAEVRIESCWGAGEWGVLDIAAAYREAQSWSLRPPGRAGGCSLPISARSSWLRCTLSLHLSP